MDKFTTRRVHRHSAARLSRAVAEGVERRVLMSAGQLDAAFGSGGKVTTANPTGQFAYLTAVAAQANGGLVVTQGSAPSVVTRLTAAGGVDPSFGSGGHVTLLGNGSAGHVFVLPDGNVLVAGTTLEELTPTGTVAPGFGGSAGYVAVGGPADGTGSSAVGPDGRIVVDVGTGVERYDADGSVDTTFGAGGFASFVAPSFAAVNSSAVAVDPQGRVVVSLGVRPTDPAVLPGGNYEGFVVERLTAAGVVDASFGTSGLTAYASANGGDANATAVAVAADGTVYAARDVDQGEGDDRVAGLGGYSPAGTLEGTLAAPFTNGSVAALAVQADGKVLATGYVVAHDGSGNPTAASEFAARFTAVSATAAGGADVSFNGTGLATVNYASNGSTDVDAPPDTGDVGRAVAVAANGDVVVAGTANEPNASPAVSAYTVTAFQGTTPTPTGTPLTGTVIGTAGSFGNGGNTAARAFDGNVNTYFDAPVASGAYAGLDLGSAATITRLGYAPRSGWAFRMTGGQFQASNAADFGSGVVTLYTVPATPAVGVLTTVPVSAPGTYRYVRYLGPTGGYCDVAEAQFFGTRAAAAPLTGTVIGTAGSFGNGGNTATRAFDGNVNTFFDAPTANGAFAGLDLGAAAAVTQVSYAPRSGFANRMVGGTFQASNSATFASFVTLYTVAAAPAVGGLTTVPVSAAGTYRYVRYVGPAGSYCNVAEVRFAGSPGATAAPLAGTVFGTAGSFGNGGNTIARAADGNVSTYYDGAVANGNVVGLDLGTARAVARVGYAPRAGFESRMVGGTVQASNAADFSSGVVTAYTVTAAPVAGQLTTVAVSVAGSYRYWRYVSPAGSYGNVAEFELFAS